MKSLDFQAKFALGLVVSSIVFLILSDLIGQEYTISIFQWGFLAGVVHWGICRIFDAYENHEYKWKVRRRTLRKFDRRIEAMNFLRAENHYGFWALDIRTGEAKAEFAPPKGPKAVTYNGSDPLEIEAPRPSALAMLRDVSCGLIAGGRGAGKTECVRHIAAERAANGWTVVLIDPKPEQPHKWPGCRVVGSGNDYGAIAAELTALCEMMGSNRGQTLVIIDEATRLKMRIPGFADLWLPVLLEGREYGLDIWIIGQSKTAESVGLTGKYDLLACFDAVALAKRDGAEHWIEIETEGNPKPIAADHPGPLLIPGGAAGQVYQRTNEDDDGEVVEGEVVDPPPERKRGPVALLDYVRLSGSARKVRSYIERNGGAVERGKLLASRSIGRKAKAKDYDAALTELEGAGRIDVDRSGPMAKWEYRLTD